MKKVLLTAITLTMIFSGQSFANGLLDVLTKRQVRVLDGLLTAVENGKRRNRSSASAYEAPEYQSYSCEKLEQAIIDRISDRDHRIFEANEIKKILKNHDEKNVIHKFLIEHFTFFNRDNVLWEGYFHMEASKIIDREISNMNRFYSGKCK